MALATAPAERPGLRASAEGLASPAAPRACTTRSRSWPLPNRALPSEVVAGRGLSLLAATAGAWARLQRSGVRRVPSRAPGEAQTKGLEAFVASQPGHVITHRFIDQASGATLERPGLQAALAAAKAGEFDVLLVYRIDRLTRSIVGLMGIVEALDAAGVALRSATEPIDTQGPVGRMLLQLLGIFAEFERSLLIDRISKGFERKAARGEWLGCPGPFGYQVDPRPRPSFPLRRRRRRSGGSSRPTQTSTSVPPGSRTTSTARGCATVAVGSGGTRPSSGYCATRFTSARSSMESRLTTASTPQSSTTMYSSGPNRCSTSGPCSSSVEQRAPNTSDYLLTGLLRCRACGGAYFGAGTKGRNGFYRYYACRNRQTKGTYGCRAKRVAAEDLESAVIDVLIQTLSRADLFEPSNTGQMRNRCPPRRRTTGWLRGKS